MKNLNPNNIRRDFGKVDLYEIRKIEISNSIILPNLYKNFIINHNEARLIANSFNYFNSDVEEVITDSFAFISVQKIESFIRGLLSESIDDPDYFLRKLIPFGDNGGGDFICFDYRNHDSNNPPIIIWEHDVYDNSKRVSFIANNFEEFINMLHEPED